MERTLETETSSSSSDYLVTLVNYDDDSEEEQQQTASLDDDRRFKLMNQVFNQELLREMIINYVIHNGRKLSVPDIQNCRLVQKPWLHTVSKLHRKQRHPLLFLHLDKENSLELSTQQTGKLLNQFLNKALNKTSPTFMGEHVPPFAIKATQYFFEDENYKNFKDALFKCGSGLVRMYLEIPKNGGSMSFVFPLSPPLSLPILTKFTVHFAEETDNNTEGNNATSIHLLQLILSASRDSLKLFELPLTDEDGDIPAGIEYLTLPETITTLRLSCPMKSKDLRILLNNSLPNVKKFELYIPQTPAFDDGLLPQALAPLSETVEVAHFSGIEHDGVPSRPTYLGFPAVMKKLKNLSIASTHLQLTNGSCSLETSLPELKSLTLRYQTVPMIRKWMNNSKFESVRELQMSLVDENLEYDEDYFVNVEVEIMQSLHLAFPNLKTLEITVVCGAEMSGLEYLFLEMKHLENLEIDVRGTENLATSDVWDSLLTGVPVEIATALRTTPELYDFFELKNETRPSIRNLKHLRRLKLTTEDAPPALAEVPLISDSVFVFGFLKMLNLKILLFGGRFVVSNEMKKKWKAGQKIILSVD